MAANSQMPPDPARAPASSPGRAPAEELEAALQNSCSALLAVEAIRADARDLAGQMHRIHAQLTRSIHDLRSAIRTLRETDSATPLSHGFVLPGEGHPRSTPGQTTP